MTALQIACRTVSVDRAHDHLQAFPLEVIVNYDFAGNPAGKPAAHDVVMLEDLGRIAFMFNRNGLTAGDATALLNIGRKAAADGLWNSVPHHYRFEDLDLDDPDLPSHPVFRLYKLFQATKGLGAAKVSKLLHIMRPNLFPIIDSRFTGSPRGRGIYTLSARRAASDSAVARSAGWRTFYWKAIQQDLRHNRDALASLGAEYRHRSDDQAAIASLTPLRLQDIIAWSEAGHRGPDDHHD